MDTKQIRDNIWGRYGFPSYSDHSVSEETRLAVLAKMGYIDTDLIKFDSWKGIADIAAPRGHLDDIAPCSIRLNYYPESSLLSSPLKIDLYTKWGRGNQAGCEIPAIPTISNSSWVPYPVEKNPQSWDDFYNSVVLKLRAIESQLISKEWFFKNDNFENFTYTDEDGWSFQGKPVDFERVSFGFFGSYWGTLWYYR